MVNTPKADLFNGTLDVTAVIVAVFISLALYNSLELITLVFFTFKKWKGLYFWSLFVAGISIIFYTVGISLYYYATGPPHLAGMIVNNVAWISSTFAIRSD